MVQCGIPRMVSGFTHRCAQRTARAVTCVLTLVVLAGVVTPHVRAADPSVQAFWVSATTLEAPDGARRAIAAAIGAGMNAIVAPAPLYADRVPDRFLELLRLALVL